MIGRPPNANIRIGCSARTIAVATLTSAIWLTSVIWQTAPAIGYPLDGYEATGIQRLEAYRLAQSGKVRGRLLTPGARLPGETVSLKLVEPTGSTESGAAVAFAIPEIDAAFDSEISALLQHNADAYGVAILDLTDPQHPRLAAHNTEMSQNPASVGKLMVALGWFQALADLYPGDDPKRDALMYDTQVTADAFIRSDSHDVPFWLPGDPKIDFRPLREGDTANLWTWLDWMLSSSSNAAASQVMAQLVLLKHFGTAYPVPADTAKQFLRDTPRAKLSQIFADAIQTPVTRNGLDIQKLRQGSFFTREGKNRIPGTSSTATPMALLQFMVRMEQGTLVDRYSSLTLKRLLYLSERRIRYASSTALRRAAVYFKSGSWYTCKPESGFQCGKYMGNVRNFLNSVVSVETQDEAQLHYIAIVLSNVLRKNSATVHKNLATEIHRVIEAYHADGGAAGGDEPEADPSAEAATGPIDEMDFDGENDAAEAELSDSPDSLDSD